MEEKRQVEQERKDEQDPQVYAVQKDLAGWRFSRRGFLAAAGAAAAAAGASLACGSSTPEPEVERVVTATVSRPPTEAAPTEVVVEEEPTVAPEPTLEPEDKLTACYGVKAHDGSVWALEISPDGTLLVSGARTEDEMETIKLWSLPDGAFIKTLEAELPARLPLVISPDGALLASRMLGDDNSIVLWSLPDGEFVNILEGGTPIAFSQDGTFLISGGTDNAFNMWSLPDGELIRTLEGHEESAWILEVSPDGTLMASAGMGGIIKLWSLPDGELLKSLEGHEGNIWNIKIAPGFGGRDGDHQPVVAAGGRVGPDPGRARRERLGPRVQPG